MRVVSILTDIRLIRLLLQQPTKMTVHNICPLQAGVLSSSKWQGNE